MRDSLFIAMTITGARVFTTGVTGIAATAVLATKTTTKTP